MCSGLTAYSALKRLAERAARAPLLLVGAGGVGLMGLALARALYRTAPFVADIDAEQARGRARRRCCRRPSIRPIRARARRLLKATAAACYAACDFVGSDKSLAFATGVLAKGGKVMVTGLIGGTYPAPVAMFVLKAMTIEGTLTGTLAEARELIELVRAKKIAAPPIAERPLNQAQATLDDLRARTDCGARCFDRLKLRHQPAHEVGQAGLALALEPFGGEDRLSRRRRPDRGRD